MWERGLRLTRYSAAMEPSRQSACPVNSTIGFANICSSSGSAGTYIAASSRTRLALAAGSGESNH